MRRNPLVPVAAAAIAIAIASTAAARGSAKITPPPKIAAAGKIVWCSDIEYPPEEYYKGGKAIGSDIDIGTQISKLMGVKAEFKNVVFDNIIAALLAKKCDANRDFLIASSKKLEKAGKKPITVVPFPKDTDAFAALLAGRVDAYFADAPPAAYYAKQNASKVEVCCHPINPIPIGIAIRKHDPLRAAMKKGVNILYSTGAMKRIVAKWGMTNAAVLLKK